MRNPRAPAWARPALFPAALISTIAVLLSTASAEEKFPRLFVFGDSYADVTLAGPSLNPPHPPLWTVYPIPLATDLQIPGTAIANFAVGGARASPDGPPAAINPPGWHLKQQVDEFLKTTGSIGARDLVTLNIGGNDGLGLLQGFGPFIGYPTPLGPMTVANAPDFAKQTATYAIGQIEKLVGAGGRTFVLGGIQRDVRPASPRGQGCPSRR